MSWHIATWSRELGRGTLGGSTRETLPFDASIADVDDFVIGEDVEVRLEREGESWRVLRVSPTARRMPEAGKEGPSPVPSLRPDVEAAVTKALLAASSDADRWRVISYDGERLVLESSSNGAYPPLPDRLVFEGVAYFEHANEWEASHPAARLGFPGERARVLRTQLDDLNAGDMTEGQEGDFALIVFPDGCKQERFYFVVCRSACWTGPPASGPEGAPA